MEQDEQKLRWRRVSAVLIIAAIVVGGVIYQAVKSKPINLSASVGTVNSSPAINGLAKLSIKGRAPKTGYSRDKFSSGWAKVGGCDMRERILQRDLTQKVLDKAGCNVLLGTLSDPYTGQTISFTRGPKSAAVQIDHVVAVSDAWQKGAQQLSAQQRHDLYNDPLELLAVDGPTNVKKGDGDAATWLPPNKDFRCRYVARQIAVKLKYALWLTQAEHDAMGRVLSSCPGQVLPVVSQ